MSAESYIFDKAMEEKTEPQAITSEKFYLDLNDQNNGNYKNQQLIFDLSSLSLVDGWTSLEDSVIRIPYQVTATSSAENFAADATVKGLVNLKGNFTSVVDSMSVMLDNRVIRTFSSHSEVPAYFNLISSMSEDYKKVASSIVNQEMDSGNGTYTTALGEHLLTNAAIYNKSRRVADSGDASGFQELVNITNKSKSHYVRSTDKKLTWNYMFEIPLKHLDDLFQKIPLGRGYYLKLNMQIHSGTCSFVSTAKAISAASSTTTYGTLPFMVSVSTLSAGTHGVLAAAGASTIKIEAGILQNAAAAAKNPLLGSCQFHACIYKARLNEEKRLLQRPPVEIHYNQAMFQTHRNVPANTAFAFQISSSSSRPSHLLIHTRLSDTINMSESVQDQAYDNTSNAVPMGTMASPFSSSPMTTKPYSSLSQMQLSIGGMPVYSRGPLNVDYDFYNDNFRSFNSVNGGKDAQDCSGLISREEWEKNYGYVVVDLRKYDMHANWLAPKDISITATNNSPNKVDYMFYLFEERDFKLDCSTGKILV